MTSLIIPTNTEKLEMADPGGNPKLSEERVGLKKGEDLYKDDKLLQAGRILSNLNESFLEEQHKKILEKARVGEDMMSDLKSSLNNNEWIKQGRIENPATLIYYKLEKSDEKIQLLTRIETPIHSSLLVPLLSVLNETELYQSWLPNWSTPRMKIRKCTKVAQVGRVSQIILLTFDLPWPITARELVLSAMAFDDIDENGEIGIHLTNLEIGDQEGAFKVPPQSDAVRVSLDGGFLFRKCPTDHEELESFKKEQKILRSRNSTNKENDGDDDEILLVSFCMCLDPKLRLLPQSLLNFIVRTAMGTAWKFFLEVANDVKDGKREAHARYIKQKRGSLYDWVDSRVKIMFSLVKSLINQPISTV